MCLKGSGVFPSFCFVLFRGWACSLHSHKRLMKLLVAHPHMPVSQRQKGIPLFMDLFLGRKSFLRILFAQPLLPHITVRTGSE